jgi:hypothetical protein
MSTRLLIAVFFSVAGTAISQSIFFVNNCPSASGATLKAWIEGIYQVDVPFRHVAQNGVEFAPGTLTIGVSAPTASNISDGYQLVTVSLDGAHDLIIVFNGLLDNQGQPSNVTPLALSIYSITNNAVVPPGKIEHYYIDGCTDATSLSINTGDPNPVNLMYTQLGKPAPRDTVNSILQVTTQNSYLGGYNAEFQRYKDIDNRVVILVSGLANGSPGFGLFRIPANYFQDEVLPLEPLNQVMFASIKERTGLSGIKLAPIPVNSILTLGFDLQPQMAIKCVLYSLSGKKILDWDGNVNDKKFYLNMTDVAAGVYLLEVDADNMKSQFKVVKN